MIRMVDALRCRSSPSSTPLRCLSSRLTGSSPIGANGRSCWPPKRVSSIRGCTAPSPDARFQLINVDELRAILRVGAHEHLVAGQLAASGPVGLVYGLVATEFLAASTFPGPVFGVIIGLPILGLAVAHAAKTARVGGG